MELVSGVISSFREAQEVPLASNGGTPQSPGMSSRVSQELAHGRELMGSLVMWRKVVAAAAVLDYGFALVDLHRELRMTMDDRKGASSHQGMALPNPVDVVRAYLSHDLEHLKRGRSDELRLSTVGAVACGNSIHELRKLFREYCTPVAPSYSSCLGLRILASGLEHTMSVELHSVMQSLSTRKCRFGSEDTRADKVAKQREALESFVRRWRSSAETFDACLLRIQRSWIERSGSSLLYDLGKSDREGKFLRRFAECVLAGGSPQGVLEELEMSRNNLLQRYVVPKLPPRPSEGSSGE